LEPHHFRAIQDHASEHAADTRRSIGPYRWGVDQLNSYLKPNGSGDVRLILRGLDATLPDGQRLTHPGTIGGDELSLSIREIDLLDGRADVWISANDGRQSASASIEHVELEGDLPATRTIRTSARLKPVTLCSGEQPQSASLQLARVVVGADGMPMQDPSFVPATTDAWQWSVLRDATDEIIDGLTRLADELKRAASDPTRPSALADLLDHAARLTAARSSAGVLAALRDLPRLHPADLHVELRRAAAGLGISRHSSFVYTHEVPADSLRALADELLQHRPSVRPSWRRCTFTPSTSGLSHTLGTFSVPGELANASASIEAIFAVDDPRTLLPDRWHDTGAVKLTHANRLTSSGFVAGAGLRLSKLDDLPAGFPRNDSTHFYSVTLDGRDASPPPTASQEWLAILTPGLAGQADLRFALYVSGRPSCN
jgi:hypothetical protein